MASILEQQEEALPKPYSSCAPTTTEFKSSTVKGPLWTQPLCGQGLFSESYTEVLLKQPFFPPPVPETFLSVSSLTLNFPPEQKDAYSPHPQPHSRACLKLPTVCQTGRGSACLQGGPKLTEKAERGKTELVLHRPEPASLLKDDICCLIQLNQISPFPNKKQMGRYPPGCLKMNPEKTPRETCPEGC